MSVFDRRFTLSLPRAVQPGQPPIRADLSYWPATGGRNALYAPGERITFDRDLYAQVYYEDRPALSTGVLWWKEGVLVQYVGSGSLSQIGDEYLMPITPGTGIAPADADFISLPNNAPDRGRDGQQLRYLLWWDFEPGPSTTDRKVWAHWTDQGGTIELTEGGVQQAAEGLVTVHWTPELIRVLTTVDLNNVRLTDHLGRTYSARSVREIGRRRHIEITVRRVDP